MTLNGSGSSDPDAGDTLSYRWEQDFGSAHGAIASAGVTLSDNTAVSPTFTAPSSATVLTFKLTVTDSQGASDSDTASITVQAPGDSN